MSERILITGSSGYIGNALQHKLAKTRTHQIIGVDNGDRARWVSQVGGSSATKYNQFPFFNSNLQDINGVINLLNYFRPTAIIHLASQPSGPYSEISHQHRIGTQINNLTMLMNLLGVVHDLKLDTRFIIATTTGIAGSPGGQIEEAHSPNLAGSTYHVSRGFDSANLQLAAKQWKLRILELRTSIVYGTRINEMDEPVTRLDYDFWFGTVIHRFCVAAKAGIPIKVYGKGLQEKPFISLNDCVQSFVNSLDTPIKPGHEIMNQTTHCASIKTLAEMISDDVMYIQNPRVENEDYRMVIHNEKFMKLLNCKSPSKQEIENEIDKIKNDIQLELLTPNYRESYDGILPGQPIK